MSDLGVQSEGSAGGLALVVHEPGAVSLQRRRSQPLAASDVRVEPRFVGLCGTDLAIIDGALDEAIVRYPIVLGHEWAGSVVEVGKDVEVVAVGDPVVVEGMLCDGTCVWCQQGRTNLCVNCKELGLTLDGAASFEICVSESIVHRVPNVALMDAVLIEPLAVVLTALEAVTVEPGCDVLVVGDGTIGLLAAQLVRRWDVRAVTILGQRPAQRELASAMGAEFILAAPEVSRPFGLAIDAAGGSAAVSACFGAVARGGSVVLLGGSGGESVVVSPDTLVDNDVTVRGSFSYTASAWRRAVGIADTGSVLLGEIVTHCFALEDYASALEVLRDRDCEVPRGKVMLDMKAGCGTEVEARVVRR